MNGPALERLHGVEGDRVAGHLHLARRAHRDLAHRVLPALPVPLHVHDDPLAFRQVSPDHHVGDRLQGSKRLAPPADERAQVAAADVEGDRVGTRPDSHLRADAHVLEQALHQAAGHLSFSVGGSGARGGASVVTEKSSKQSAVPTRGTAEATGEVTLIGNIRKKVYHLSTCADLRSMNPSNRTLPEMRTSRPCCSMRRNASLALTIATFELPDEDPRTLASTRHRIFPSRSSRSR